MTWRDEAACRGTFNLMFDPERVDIAMAFCAYCPVSDECEATRLASKPVAGVWAGVIQEKGERSRLYRLRIRESQLGS